MRRLFEWFLALALGFTLLFRGIEWYAGHLDRLSHAPARAGGAAAVGHATSGAAAPRPSPKPSLTPPSAGAVVPRGEEEQPGLIAVGGDAAFSVAPNLYATSESLTDGYGHLSRMSLPGALITGRVVAHDRGRSGVALVATPDMLPRPSLSLATAASLRPGQRVRALYPVPAMVPGPALSTPGSFKGIVLENGVVRLDLDLHGQLLLKGAPILDDEGRVVGIVVSRRDEQKPFFVAADHIETLLRQVRSAPP